MNVCGGIGVAFLFWFGFILAIVGTVLEQWVLIYVNDVQNGEDWHRGRRSGDSECLEENPLARIGLSTSSLTVGCKADYSNSSSVFLREFYNHLEAVDSVETDEFWLLEPSRLGYGGALDRRFNREFEKASLQSSASCSDEWFASVSDQLGSSASSNKKLYDPNGLVDRLDTQLATAWDTWRNGLVRDIMVLENVTMPIVLEVIISAGFLTTGQTIDRWNNYTGTRAPVYANQKDAWGLVEFLWNDLKQWKVCKKIPSNQPESKECELDLAKIKTAMELIGMSGFESFLRKVENGQVDSGAIFEDYYDGLYDYYYEDVDETYPWQRFIFDFRWYLEFDNKYGPLTKIPFDSKPRKENHLLCQILFLVGYVRGPAAVDEECTFAYVLDFMAQNPVLITQQAHELYNVTSCTDAVSQKLKQRLVDLLHDLKTAIDDDDKRRIKSAIVDTIQRLRLCHFEQNVWTPTWFSGLYNWDRCVASGSLVGCIDEISGNVDRLGGVVAQRGIPKGGWSFYAPFQLCLEHINGGEDGCSFFEYAASPTATSEKDQKDLRASLKEFNEKFLKRCKEERIFNLEDCVEHIFAVQVLSSFSTYQSTSRQTTTKSDILENCGNHPITMTSFDKIKSIMIAAIVVCAIGVVIGAISLLAEKLVFAKVASLFAFIASMLYLSAFVMFVDSPIFKPFIEESEDHDCDGELCLTAGVSVLLTLIACCGSFLAFILILVGTSPKCFDWFCCCCGNSGGNAKMDTTYDKELHRKIAYEFTDTQPEEELPSFRLSSRSSTSTPVSPNGSSVAGGRDSMTQSFELDAEEEDAEQQDKARAKQAGSEDENDKDIVLA